MYIYTPLCRYWITLYRYVLVFIVPHVDIELEDNKQFILNIPRVLMCWSIYFSFQLNTYAVFFLAISYTLLLWSIYFTTQLNTMHLNTDAVIYLLNPSTKRWCCDLSSLNISYTLMLGSISVYFTSQLNTDYVIYLLYLSV